MSVPLARLVRSGMEESLHRGSVAVVDADGRLAGAAGDPSRVTFMRSAAKPFQAAAALVRMGELDLPDEEVAVMAASHNAEPPHLAAVRSLLARGGLDDGALRCPPARPLDPDPERRAVAPRPLLHDCSGKHAGMLLAAVRAGDELASYLHPEHPGQRASLALVAEAAEASPVAVGVDGCGAPAPALPLVGLATAFARLSDPVRLGRHAAGAARVVEAMRAAPYLVAGRGRVCTTLMASSSELVVKVGAEGTVGAALLDRRLGVAIKVDDGSARARDAALVHALALLGVIDPDEERLRSFAAPPVLGGGRVVGELRADFVLT